MRHPLFVLNDIHCLVPWILTECAQLDLLIHSLSSAFAACYYTCTPCALSWTGHQLFPKIAEQLDGISQSYIVVPHIDGTGHGFQTFRYQGSLCINTLVSM